ncbi:hypothetical protein AK812_SmicGene6324 [Symbiodinium microadriaticum]|uniref:Uncharacterized protein n=1 Tax=Symbiodinium microadriaticum TaxID=2951 RepID=A0A1Q9ERH0_SYMMI|nr:hypothetical protein AK812_SmicGene6324 [Symbiodinium microadriaticum]
MESARTEPRSVAWELRKILRLVLPPAVPEDVPVFCRDLQGTLSRNRRRPRLLQMLVVQWEDRDDLMGEEQELADIALLVERLDRTVAGTLSADFALRGPASGFETATAARLAACIARASARAQGSGTSLTAQSLLHRAEVQLVMKRVRKDAASESNRGAGVERLLAGLETEQAMTRPRMTEVPE